jgi:hypothetical protein
MATFIKISPVGAELFHAEDGRAHMKKPTFVFRNFANAPNQYRGKLTAVTVTAQMLIEQSGEINLRC